MALTFCLACFAIYAILNLLAMLVYPGGTSTDPGAEGYSFRENFFSDLGMLRTYGGKPKALSLVLFASATGLIGVAFVLFFVTVPSFFAKARLVRVASRLGSAAGVLAGMSCMGIAATPWDRFMDTHLAFVYALSLSFLMAVVCYTIAIVANKRYPNAYACVFAVYLVILSVYVGLLFLGPDTSTEDGIAVLAVGQKTVIYSGMVCWSVQFLGARRHLGQRCAHRETGTE